MSLTIGKLVDGNYAFLDTTRPHHHSPEEESHNGAYGKASGKDVKRPQLEAMLAFVREGDTIVCHSMDRMVRNLDDLLRTVLGLTQRGVHVQFIKESLTFTGDDSPMANLLLSVMGAFAQFERELIKERQREGIAIAKKAGAYKGRKRSLTLAKADELRRPLAPGEKRTAIARNLASVASRPMNVRQPILEKGCG